MPVRGRRPFLIQTSGFGEGPGIVPPEVAGLYVGARATLAEISRFVVLRALCRQTPWVEGVPAAHERPRDHQELRCQLHGALESDAALLLAPLQEP